jgi:hypothetical protein
MKRWIPATLATEAIEALAQAMLRTGYDPAYSRGEFHARIAAKVLITELETLGYKVMPVAATSEQSGKEQWAH